MEIVIDKSIPENAAMLKGCRVGQQVQMTGKIVDDNDEEATVAVSSVYKNKAAAPAAEAEAPEPEEAEPEVPAPKKGASGPMAVVLGYIGKKKR